MKKRPERDVEGNQKSTHESIEVFFHCHSPSKQRGPIGTFCHVTEFPRRVL
jgi:hypothetical protein